MNVTKTYTRTTGDGPSNVKPLPSDKMALDVKIKFHCHWGNISSCIVQYYKLNLYVYLSMVIMTRDQTDPHPTNEPNIPYTSHMRGPMIHVSEKQLGAMAGIMKAIMQKSEKARFITKRLLGVRRLRTVAIR